MLFVISQIWMCLIGALLLGAILAVFVHRLTRVYALKSDVNNLALRLPNFSTFPLKSELPDVSKFLTASEVTAMLAAGGFALKSEIHASPDLSGYATVAEAQKWKAAVEERDSVIAALRTSLAKEAEARAQEIARLEAMIRERAGVAAETPVPPPVAVPVAAVQMSAKPDELKKPDDLKKIWGVGPVLEQRLHELGVTTFHQIANWTDADIDRIEPQLDTVPDRIRREDWVEQCRTLHFGHLGEALPKPMPEAGS